MIDAFSTALGPAFVGFGLTVGFALPAGPPPESGPIPFPPALLLPGVPGTRALDQAPPALMFRATLRVTTIGGLGRVVLPLPDGAVIALGASDDGGAWSSTLTVWHAADWNLDGFVDGADLDGFTAAFVAGLPSADFNQDGFVDGMDYDLFQAAFEGQRPLPPVD